MSISSLTNDAIDFGMEKLENVNIQQYLFQLVILALNNEWKMRQLLFKFIIY